MVFSCVSYLLFAPLTTLVPVGLPPMRWVVPNLGVTWLQKETDVGGSVDRYRIFLNGTQARMVRTESAPLRSHRPQKHSCGQVYDDFSLRGSLEQTRAGSPPQWVRVVDVACTPGAVRHWDCCWWNFLRFVKAATLPMDEAGTNRNPCENGSFKSCEMKMKGEQHSEYNCISSSNSNCQSQEADNLSATNSQRPDKYQQSQLPKTRSKRSRRRRRRRRRRRNYTTVDPNQWVDSRSVLGNKVKDMK